MNFTEKQKIEIAESALFTIQNTKTSVSKFAQLAGVNGGEMSFIIGQDQSKNYFVKGAWNDRLNAKKEPQPLTDRIWQKLADYLEVKTRPTYWKEFDFLNTQIITDKLHEIKETSGTAFIHGRVGMGKTYTVTKFKKQNPHHVYVVKGVETSPKELTVCIAEAVGLTNIKGSAFSITRSICHKLSQETANKPLLIIDEAEEITVKGWKVIKRIYDNLEGQLGIVILGANNILDLFEKHYNNQKATFSQIFSRFNNKEQLQELDIEDVIEVCKSLNITSSTIQKRIFDHSKDLRMLRDTVSKLLKDVEQGRMQMTVQDFDYNFL